MSKFMTILWKKRGSKDVNGSLTNPQNFPTLPNELWLPILTQAMEPSLILDAYCFSTNMEQFHTAITNPHSRIRDQVECKRAQKTRQSLSLVCRRFRALVQTVPKNDTAKWLLVTDNEPRNYNSPKLRWSDERSARECMRLDLELAFEHTHRIFVDSNRSVRTYRLVVRRKTTERGVTAEFSSLEDLLPNYTALKVAHLDLQYCSPSQQARATQDPLSRMIVETTLGGLTTLSLVMGANETRDIVHRPLRLLHLRVLFLKFPIFGVEEDALQSWHFDSLSILSLHTMERNRNIQPIPSISPVIARFLRRYGQQIHGLRLQPGPWAFPYRSDTVVSMSGYDQEELWNALSILSSFTTDFRYFHEHLRAAKIADASIRRLFSQLRLLGQCGFATVGTFVNGLQAALDVTSSCLQSLTLHNENGSLLLGPKRSQKAEDMTAIDMIIALCKERRVELKNWDGDPLTLMRQGSRQTRAPSRMY